MGTHSRKELENVEIESDDKKEKKKKITKDITKEHYISKIINTMPIEFRSEIY